MSGVAEPHRTCSIVIVNWNAGDVIEDCLRSIGSQVLEVAPQAIVWDNDSDDGSLEVLARHEGSVLVLPSSENLGFAKANNRAAEKATGEFVLFLNPDTVLEGRHCLRDLIREFDDPNVAIVGPMLLNVDGTIQKSVGSFPTVTSKLVLGVGLHRVMTDRMLARCSPADWSQTWSRDVDWLKGAALMMRSSEFREWGGFSEANFMFAEDVEIAFRAHKKSKKVRYFIGAKVTHIDDHSSLKRWSEAERMGKVVSANLAFIEDNYAPMRARLIRWTWIASILPRIALLTVLGRNEKAAVYKQMVRNLTASRRNSH